MWMEFRFIIKFYKGNHKALFEFLKFISPTFGRRLGALADVKLWRAQLFFYPKRERNTKPANKPFNSNQTGFKYTYSKRSIIITTHIEKKLMQLYIKILKT